MLNCTRQPQNSMRLLLIAIFTLGFQISTSASTVNYKYTSYNSERSYAWNGATHMIITIPEGAQDVVPTTTLKFFAKASSGSEFSAKIDTGGAGLSCVHSAHDYNPLNNWEAIAWFVSPLYICWGGSCIEYKVDDTIYCHFYRTTGSDPTLEFGVFPAVGDNFFDSSGYCPEDPEPAIEVKGNGEYIAPGQASTSPQDGTYIVCDFGEEEYSRFWINSTGDADLEIDDIELDGGDEDAFSIPSVPSMIPVDGSGYFDVYFEPESPGDYSTTLCIYSNASQNSTYCFALYGECGSPPILEVQPSSQQVLCESGEVSFNVSNTGGGTMDWTASESCDWLSLSGTSGTNSGTFRANYDANLAESDRDCWITVTAEDAVNSTEKVHVIQEGIPPCEYAISPIEADFPATGGTGSIDVEVTGSGVCYWPIESDCAWIDITSPSGSCGSGDGVLKYKVESNSGGERSCTISIADKDHKVTQKGRSKLGVKPDSREVSREAGSTTFSVSNTGGGAMDWTASESCDWLSLSGTSGTNSGTITAKYEENTGSERPCKITVKAEGALDSPKTVTVTQAGTKPYLSVEPNTREVGSGSGSITFEVSNKGSGSMDWTATFPEECGWLSLSGASGTNSGTITAKYEENTGSKRTCKITVTAPGAIGSPKEVTVTQDGDYDEKPDEGDGSADSPYVIRNIRQLQWVRNALSAHFRLGCHINAEETSSWNNGQGFTPLGTYEEPFLGTFDGNNYAITALHINRPDMNDVGLFGRIGSPDSHEGVVTDLRLVDADITGAKSVGIAAGMVLGTMSNCCVTGTVAGQAPESQTGGTVGLVYGGTLAQCSANVAITGIQALGGIAGRIMKGACVSECCATVEINGSSHCGGLVGRVDDATLSQSFAAGTISSIESAGGLAGSTQKNAKVYECYSLCVVSADSDAGGLVGSQQAGMLKDAFFLHENGGVNDSLLITGKDETTFCYGICASEFGQEATFDNDPATLPHYALSSPWDFDSIWWLGAGADAPQLRSLLAPVSVISGPSSVEIGQQACMDGSKSFSPNGYSLGYMWTLNSPEGSESILTNTDGKESCFTPDIAGQYSIKLEVDNGLKKNTTRLNVEAGQIEGEGEPPEGEVTEGEIPEGEPVEGEVVEGESPEGESPIEGESGPITVPNIEGQQLEEVQASLSTLGLQLGTVTEECNNDVPEGAIIRQDPSADTEVERNTPIDVVVSTGKCSCCERVSLQDPANIFLGVLAILIVVIAGLFFSGDGDAFHL